MHKPDTVGTPKPDVVKIAYPAMLDLENRAGVPSLEELQAERATLVALNSRVKALKDTDLWKQLRDIELAKAGARVRAAVKEGEKAPSEAFVTSASQVDPAYVSWIEQTVAMFASYEVVEDRIRQLEELVNRGQALLRYAASEPKA